MKSVKSKAPKRATKAAKAKPAKKAVLGELAQMMLQLDANQQTLLANQVQLEKRTEDLRKQQEGTKEVIRQALTLPTDLVPRVEKLEAKVFPQDPTPEDWQKAAEADYEQRLEAWRKQFRTWIESVLRSGLPIPSSVPAEHLEKAYGKDWRKVVGDVAPAAPPNTPRDFFGYTRQAPTYSWTEREEAQREANQQHRQEQARSRAYRTSRNPHAREELNRAVKRYRFKTNMPYEDVWNMLYDLVTVGLGYDPRREAVPTELPLDVLDYRGDLVLARQLLWPLLSRAEGQV